jgi:Glycosyltransferase
MPLPVSFPKRPVLRLQRSCSRIVWNQRWDFDKRPDVMLEVLGQLAADGCDFEVVLLGENLQRDELRAEAQTRLGPRVVHAGYCEGRRDYWHWLGSANVTFSVAVHEYYGLSMLEAIGSGCTPLLPRGLSYPELYDEFVSAECFYRDESELLAKLKALLSGSLVLEVDYQAVRKRYSWDRLRSVWDQAFLSAGFDLER